MYVCICMYVVIYVYVCNYVCAYVPMFLLGQDHMTANVHGLLHLPRCVETLGLLWANSCFPFEAANAQLLKLFHGSQGVEKQVG